MYFICSTVTKEMKLLSVTTVASPFMRVSENDDLDQTNQISCFSNETLWFFTYM